MISAFNGLLNVSEDPAARRLNSDSDSDAEPEYLLTPDEADSKKDWDRTEFKSEIRAFRDLMIKSERVQFKIVW